MEGGSFLTTGTYASKYSRYAFRRHFHQCSGFRYVHSSIQIDVDRHQQTVDDTNVEKCLKFHYMNEETYLSEVTDSIQKWAGKEAEEATILTVGCSVGRVPMELGRTFKHSIGIDYTCRYFQMSTRLKETGQLKYKDIDISL